MATIRTLIYVLFRCPEDDEEYVVCPFSTLQRAKARAESHWEEMVGRADDPRPSEFAWQEVEAGWISNADSPDRVEREYRIESWAMDEREEGPELPSGWVERDRLAGQMERLERRAMSWPGLIEALLRQERSAYDRTSSALELGDDLEAGRELRALEALVECAAAATGG